MQRGLGPLPSDASNAARLRAAGMAWCGMTAPNLLPSLSDNPGRIPWEFTISLSLKTRQPTHAVRPRLFIVSRS